MRLFDVPELSIDELNAIFPTGKIKDVPSMDRLRESSYDIAYRPIRTKFVAHPPIYMFEEVPK
jgi:hypothetical protein